MPGAVVGSGSSKADYHAGAKPRENAQLIRVGSFVFARELVVKTKQLDGDDVRSCDTVDGEKKSGKKNSWDR